MKYINTLLLFAALCINAVAQNVLPFKKKNQKWCFVDTSSHPINKKIYKEIVPIGLHYFLLKRKNKCALATNLGKRITPFKYDKISYYTTVAVAGKPVPSFRAYKGNTQILINKEGDKIVNYIHNLGCKVINGSIRLYSFHKGNKIGFITFYYDMISGDTIPAIFDDFKDCGHETVFVLTEGCWGAMNNRGGYIINPTYQEVRVKMDEDNFIGAFVKEDGKWGYLNYRFKLVIPPKYKEMGDFNFGYSNVITLENQSGLILENGKELFER